MSDSTDESTLLPFGDAQIIDHDKISVRTEAIFKIEGDINAIRGIMHDFQTMVKEQGVTIKTIEDAATNSTWNIQDGLNDLRYAEHQRKQQKRKRCGFWVIVVLLIILITATLFALLLKIFH